MDIVLNNIESTSGNITIRFVVHITQHNIFLQPHEIYVVGNIGELGNWEPRNGLKMKLFSHERLEAQIEIPKNMNDTIEYKYVNITSNNGQTNWEHGENRLIHNFESAEFLQIQDTYRDNVPGHAHLPAEIFALDRLFGRSIEKQVALRASSNDVVLVRFNVKAGTGLPSHLISVCGSCEQLGKWNILKACQMNYTCPNWEVDVLISRDLFPIEYKYITVYNANSSEFEVGQNRKIDLPDISEKQNSVVDLHDVFMNRFAHIYEGMTTPYNEMKAIFDFKGSKELKEFIEQDMSDNGKLIVKDVVALKTAAKYGKPYKLSKNMEEYFIEEEFSATTRNYLSLDPDVLFFNDEWADHMSKFIKANSNISILMIEVPMPESRDRTLNLNWLFNGFAKNEFPNVTSFYFNQYTNDSTIIGSLLNAIKTNKSLRLLSYRHSLLPSLRLSEALEENTSLTELQLSFDWNWRQPFNQQLVAKTIASKNRIKSLTLHEPDSLTTYAPLTRKLRKLVLLIDYYKRNQVLHGVEVFFRELKGSTTLVHLDIRGGRYDKDTDTHFQTLLKSIYDENWTLTTMNITFSPNVEEWARQLTERNRKHHKQRHENIILTLFNIARSKTALELFPKEVWMQILTELFIPSPFGYDYRSMMIDLFRQYY